MGMHMRLITLFLALLLAAPVAFAQGTKKEGARVSFRVTRFDPADRPSPTYEIGGTGARAKVEVPLTYIDGPFKANLRDDKFLDFYEVATDKPFLSVAVRPEMRKDLLLVFVPKENSYNVLQVHAPSTKIKGGDRYIVNATKGDLAIQLGKAKPILVKPARSGLLSGPGGKKIETLPVTIKQKNGEDWKLVSTEHWTCDPRFRSFLFIYRSARTGHISFHGVSDRLDMLQ